jgi:hypothetical protein
MVQIDAKTVQNDTKCRKIAQKKIAKIQILKPFFRVSEKKMRTICLSCLQLHNNSQYKNSHKLAFKGQKERR